MGSVLASIIAGFRRNATPFPLNPVSAKVEPALRRYFDPQAIV
jgi:hypothetical protein